MDSAMTNGTGGDPRVRVLFEEMWALHVEKGRGYGTDKDTFANLRATAWLGLPAWKFCLVRASDKWARIQNHVQKESIPGDSLDNDLRDMAMYLLYAKILYEEEVEVDPTVKATAEMYLDVRRELVREGESGILD